MSRNLIKEYVDFSQKNLKTYTKNIMSNHYDEDIFNRFLSAYINIRYYDQEPSMGLTLSSHLNYYLTKIYNEDKNIKAKFILELFKKYYYIENVIDFDYSNEVKSYAELINKIRIEKVGIDDSSFTKSFERLLIDNKRKKDNYISAFDSNDFSLKINKIKDNIYDIDIENSVTIPKIFSEYAINQVWNNKLITENKLEVEYYLINNLLLKNIINRNFDNDYLVDIAISLFEKNKKLQRLLNIFDNDIGRDRIIMKICYGDFIANKEIILSLIKRGYNFAIILDDEYIKDNSNKSILDVFKYIIINDNKYLTNEIENLMNLIILM